MKHSEAMFRAALVLAALATSFFMNSPGFSFSTNNTHPALTQEVAGFFNAQSKQKLSSEEVNWLRQGAIEEDEPMRYNNHFYNPVIKTGWSGKYFGSLSQAEGLAKGADAAPRAPIASIDWVTNQANQSAYGRQYGNQTWQKAIKSYLDNDKKSAFIALGHTMHLIEDMAVPDHTRDDTHAGLYGDPGSPFEEYAKNYTNFNKLAIAQNLVSQNKSIPSFQTIQDAFIGLANYSNKNFFSEDTISNEEFREPGISQLKIKKENSISYLFNQSLGLFLAKVNIDEGFVRDKEVRPYSTNDKSFVLPSYRDHLFPQAVLTGAGVMELFFKEVEKYQNNPEAMEPIAPNQNEPLLSIIMHAPKLALLNTYDAWDRAVVSTQVALAKSGETLKNLAQKVKLAALVGPFQTTPSAPSPSAPHSTLSPEWRGDSFTPPLTPPQRGGEVIGQVLGEQVGASNMTAPTTPAPPQRGGDLSATSTPEKTVKKEVKKESEKKAAATIVAKENIKSNNPSSSKEIASPALREGRGRNDKKEGGLRDDSKEAGGSADLAGKNDNIAPSNPHPTLSLEGRGNNKPAPTRPSVSYFIGIHAPAPATSASSADEPASPPPPPPPPPDTIPPITWITILSATTTAASFPIQWSGTDNIQATPASYDIQYQTITLGGGAASSLSYPWQVGVASFNANDWLDWLLATSTASSTFTGQDEKTYGFRSRGRDQEGNQSIYPSTAETFTYLNLSAPNPPTITSHSNNQTITESDDIASTTAGVQITLAGAADLNDIVAITLSSSGVASSSSNSVMASSTGAWLAVLTLAEGANTITLQSQETDGDISSSTSITLNLVITPSREVVINEIAWMGTSAGTADEWIELYNPGNTAIDLTGWKLFGDDGNTLILNLTGQITGQGYYLIERTDDSTVSDIPADIFGSFSGNGLSNNGELLTLRKSDGVLADRAGSSTTAWFSGNNSSAANRASMERKNPTVDGEDTANWASNDTLFINGQDADSANLKATPKSLNSANTTIPRPTADLTIQRIYTTNNTVKLYWTAPLNANLNINGSQAYYDLRYTTGAGCTINESNFETATAIASEPTPSETVGTAQSLVITTLTASTPYCFALKTYNGANMSGLSNVVSATTRASPAGNPLTRLGFLNDTFPNGYTITVSNSPYLADTSLRIAAGASVTIEAGVVIKMAHANSQWLIDGQLTANGTALNPVVITSVKDDTFAGDTNNNGSATWPNGGDWYRFQVSGAAARLTLNSTIMRYGGRSGSPMIALTGGAAAVITGSILEHSGQNAIAMGNDSTALTLANSTLRNNDLEGVGISSRANAAIQGSTFTNNRRGIAIDTNADIANLTISGNNFYANNANPGSAPNAGIHFSDADDTLTAANNWWGSALGPTTASPDNDSARDAALGNINYAPWAESAFAVSPNGF